MCETYYGFKKITGTNWSQPDLPIIFPYLTESIWIEAVLQPKLNLAVPIELQALYEVARASFVYGWLYYPFITQGSEQCLRVLEAAARAKCEQLGFIQKKGRTFSSNIDFLVKSQVIPPAESALWQTTRRLRNAASHPRQQDILPPGMALPLLTQTAERINRLFV